MKRRLIKFFDPSPLEKKLTRQANSCRDIVYAGLLKMCDHVKPDEYVGFAYEIRPYCWLVRNHDGVGTLFFVDDKARLYGIYFDKEEEEWSFTQVKK